MKIDWRQVWAAFNKWCAAHEKTYGTVPSWDKQRAKIKLLVEQSIK